MNLLRPILLSTAALAAVLFLFPYGDDMPPQALAAISSEVSPESSNDAERNPADFTAEHAGIALPDEAAAGVAARLAARRDAMHQLLDHARKHPGNLSMALRELRAQCVPDEDCDALIRSVLQGYADADFAGLVEQAMTRLPLYEEAMQNTVMSTQVPPRERYAEFHALREQTLGPAVTEALFGQEAAWADYQFNYGDLMDNAEGLSAAERLQRLDALRDASFGTYADALSQIEGTDGRYQRELALLLAGVEDAGERQRITDELRRQHYDADTLARLAHRDRQQAEAAQQVEAYQADLARLRQDMAALSETLPEAVWQQQYEQALTQLRRQHFP